MKKLIIKNVKQKGYVKINNNEITYVHNGSKATRFNRNEATKLREEIMKNDGIEKFQIPILTYSSC